MAPAPFRLPFLLLHNILLGYVHHPYSLVFRPLDLVSGPEHIPDFRGLTNQALGIVEYDLIIRAIRETSDRALSLP